jgi:hypothetical protein
MSKNYDQWELRPEPIHTGRSNRSSHNRLLWTLVVVMAIAIAAMAGYLVWGAKTDRVSLPVEDEAQPSSSSAMQTVTRTQTATVTETTITQTQQEQAVTAADGYISAVQTSRGTIVPASMACDGHYVVIVQSVLGGDNLSTRQELARALEQDSRLQYATPGLCPSLRPSKDGQDVYAVYFDTDSAAEACSLKGQWGGNVRALKNEADYYSDPC